MPRYSNSQASGSIRQQEEEVATALAGCCRGLWLYCGSFGDSLDVQALDRREPPTYRPGVNSLFLTAVPESLNTCHVSCVVDRVEEISILCR